MLRVGRCRGWALGITGSLLASVAAPTANAADLFGSAPDQLLRGSDAFGSSPASFLRTETFSAEVDAGYLTGRSSEYVYDTTAAGNPRLSQLNWDLGNSYAVGGRVAYRPLDWLTVRARGWSVVAGQGDMHDYDWLYGFYGFNSYSDVSSHPHTDVAKAWQGDVSVAATYYQDDTLALTAIAGYRHYDVKFNAKDGHFNYNIASPYQVSGTFPNQIVGAYEQWWDTPYLGLGASYKDGAWGFSLEGIASPYAMSRDQDHHALRELLIKRNYTPTTMVGINAGLEYQWSPMLSLAGRVEYQKYVDTKGEAQYLDNGYGTYTYYPKPGSGAGADTLLLSLGVKAKL